MFASSSSSHYETLNIPEGCNSLQEIKKGYHEAAKRWHPDKNKNSDESKRRFQAIKDAYDTLNDVHKKRCYDSSDNRWNSKSDATAINIIDVLLKKEFESVIRLCREIFHGKRESSKEKGTFDVDDAETDDLYFSKGKKETENNKRIDDESDDESDDDDNINNKDDDINNKDDNINNKDDNINYEDQDHVDEDNIDELTTSSSTCLPMITATRIDDIVKIVNISLRQAYSGIILENIEFERWWWGTRKKKETDVLSLVEIHRGVESNEDLVFYGKGHVWDENTRGDVLVRVVVVQDYQHDSSSPFLFSRMGMDLFHQKRVTLKEALCGFSFRLTHYNGTELEFDNENKNKVIIRPGLKKKLSQMGMVRHGQQTGNLIIEFIVDFPDELSSDQISVLKSIL